MSQSSNVPAGIEEAIRDEEISEQMTFTLVVVSPSAGVSGPLTFPLLPATTTVKELKAKVRDALPSNPADESQRLIHRGRLLARDTETMLDIFGQEALGHPQTQTLHLVLRPTSVDPPSTSTPSVGSQRVTSIPVPPPPQLLARPQTTPANLIQGMQAQQPSPGLQHAQQHQIFHQAEQIQNAMAPRLQQLQREALRLQQEMGNIEQRYRALATANPGIFNDQPGTTQAPLAGPQNSHQLLSPLPALPSGIQNLITQQQRLRAVEGRHGVQDSGANGTAAGQPRPASSGRASPSVHRPDHTTTYTREGIGPNGERWQVTVNESTATFPMAQAYHHHNHNHHHTAQHGNNNPALDNLQAILRNVDRTLAVQHLQNNMERAASNPPPLAGGSGTPAGVATPATNNSSPSFSVPLNAALHANIAALNSNVPAVNTTPAGHVDPVVYLLLSPSGPRALLLNNSDTFYTPRQPSRRRQNDSPAPAQGQHPQAGPAVGVPEFGNRDAQRAVRRGHRNRHENNPLEQVDAAPHANPGAGALAAQIGPIIWLIARLVGFVWFFTAGNSSWTRWFMVSGLAVAVFIVNTGIFNGIFEQLWGPIRRHIETLIPLAGPEAALVPAVNAAVPPQPGAGAPPAAGEAPTGRRRGEPDPAQVAAHLLEQHRRRNEGWLMVHVRRAEHAILLFLASLVPGVGERHIAAREAEAAATEAERQRRIEAAAADNADSGSGEQATGSGDRAAGGGNQQNAEHQPQNADGADAHAPAPNPAPAQRLVEV